MKASLLDFMSDKRKKSKSKGKKKGKNVSVEEHGENSSAPAKNNTGSSVTVEEQAGEPSEASEKVNSAELPLREKVTSQDCDEAGLAAEKQLINDQYPNDNDKGKGKQRVEALETEASDNNTTLSPPEHPSVQRKVHAADNATDGAETSPSNDGRPPSIESSPEQKNTDASKAVTEEPKSCSEKDAILPSSEFLSVQKHAEPGKAQTEETKTHTDPKSQFPSSALVQECSRRTDTISIDSGATTSPSELAEPSSPELSATQKTTDADNAVAGEPEIPTGTEGQSFHVPASEHITWEIC